MLFLNIIFPVIIDPQFILPTLSEDLCKYVCNFLFSLSFNATSQTNLEKISSTYNKYLNPLLSFENVCISIKSEAKISSMPFTLTHPLQFCLLPGVKFLCELVSEF